MAGRGARSNRGNVHGALVDEFTHVITGGTTRNCVLKQSSTLLGDCSALCRRQETGSGQTRYRHAARTRQGARFPEERLRMATVASRGERAISAVRYRPG